MRHLRLLAGGGGAIRGTEGGKMQQRLYMTYADQANTFNQIEQKK